MKKVNNRLNNLTEYFNITLFNPKFYNLRYNFLDEYIKLKIKK